MSDNKDDDFIDDVEFDDIDDFDDDILDDDDMVVEGDLGSDDFEDDDWGDDEFSNDVSEPDTGKPAKSSSSKLLFPVLALVAIAGGVGYYYTQILNGPTAVSLPANNLAVVNQDDNMPAVDEIAIDDSIPMPSPISTNSDNAEFTAEYDNQISDNNDIIDADISEDAPSIEPPESNGVLTPMPNIISEDEAPVFADVASNEIVPVNDTLIEDEPAITETVQDIEEDIIIDAPEITSNDTDISDNISIELNEEAPITPEISPNVVDNDAIDQMEAEMQNMQATLKDEIAALKQAALQKDEAIQTLKNQINQMQDNISAKDQRLSDMDAQLKSAQSKKTEEIKPVASTFTQTKASSPKPKTTPEPVIMPKWELRSAQPGRAFVSIKGSKDVQVVETGDTLQGIGKITSIAVKNGLWVVQGTRSQISQ